MGRPLNKKYFGNRNVGTTASDRGLGGNQIDSITLNASYLGSYTARPVITFPAPDYATLGATTATAVMISEVLSATITGGAAGSGGYTPNNILTVTTAVGVATFTVATASSGGVATVTPLDRGSFTGPLATGAQATTVVVGAGTTTGTGCTLVVTYRAKSVSMTNKGSGYTTATLITASSVAVGAVGMTQGTSGTVVFGSSTTIGNNENAIITYAYLPAYTATGLISGAGGSSAVIGDIVKQRGKITFNVETEQGIGKCKLISTSTLTAGTMYIQATDSAGGTYYVSKLFSRTAVITTGTGVQFTTGQRVLWTFGSAVVNKSVKIANA